LAAILLFPMKIKRGCLIIDAAADAGNAIEGTEYTCIDDPIYEKNGKYYYEVNNSPTVYYRKASEIISECFSEYIYKKDIRRFYDLLR